MQKRMDSKESRRLEGMLLYERELESEGCCLIAGMDEAGRGPLAGPVVAACVIMPRDTLIEGVNDSKKLSPKKRELLYDRIIQSAIAWGVGVVSHEDIDRYNILEAAKMAFVQAYVKMHMTPDGVLVDAVKGLDIPVRTVAIIKGDQKSYTIAAASIVAKVYRDRLMVQYDSEYPEYSFCRHKGYCTEEHVEAIKIHGPCPIHRRTFLRNIRQDGQP